MNPEHSQPTEPSVSWLVRLSAAFSDFHGEILARLGAEFWKQLGAEFYWIKAKLPPNLSKNAVGAFVRWNLPLEHTWPVNPGKAEGFIEKAAQALWKKFGSRRPQGVFVGVLNPGSPDPYYRQLASNLRGRLVQIFPQGAAVSVETQNPDAASLFCLVGKEGLFCGMATPRATNGFYPGGSKFISTAGEDVISRAGAKVAEALHYLRLHRPSLPTGAHWLELGASPGGMTMELLKAGYRVTAVDRAVLDRRVPPSPLLTFFRAEVAQFIPSGSSRYDALLCDMNGDAAASLKEVIRLSRWLRPRALILFVLKLHGVESVAEAETLMERTMAAASRSGLRLVARTHLTYNRHEFTCFFECAGENGS